MELQPMKSEAFDMVAFAHEAAGFPYKQLAVGLARSAAGLPLLDELDALALAEHEAHEADVAREGDGTLIAQAIAAEIAITDHRAHRRAAKEALAATQVRLYRPGRVFDAA